MRIIAGIAKGHKLKTLKGKATRPTSGRVREAVFNIWGSKIKGAYFLDLFAGSGAMGLEALSRGAKFCHFNDYYQPACCVIRKNIKKCGFTSQSVVTCLDWFVLIKRLIKEQAFYFDLIYLDPPYGTDFCEKLLVNFLNNPFLSPTSIITCETDVKTILQEKYSRDLKAGQSLKLFKKNKYGDTLIWFYELRGEE